MLYAERTSPELACLLPDCVAVMPIASIEQHGQHLPVFTDTAIVTELGRRVEAALPDKALLLPTMWAGNSELHMKSPGTLTITNENYTRVLVDLIDCLVQGGSRRVFVLNGHGGNHSPLTEAIYRLSVRYRDQDPPPWIAGQTYWVLAGAELAAQDFMETPHIVHACEYETSMMLALSPELVDMSKAEGCRPEHESNYYDPMDYNPSLVTVLETMEALTPNGALGSPEKGTAEKGRKLLDIIAPALVRFVDEFSTWKV